MQSGSQRYKEEPNRDHVHQHDQEVPKVGSLQGQNPEAEIDLEPCRGKEHRDVASSEDDQGQHE